MSRTGLIVLATLGLTSCDHLLVALDNQSGNQLMVYRSPENSPGSSVSPHGKYYEFGPGSDLYPGHYSVVEVSSNKTIFDGRECKGSKHFVVEKDMKVTCVTNGS